MINTGFALDAMSRLCQTGISRFMCLDATNGKRQCPSQHGKDHRLASCFIWQGIMETHSNKEGVVPMARSKKLFWVGSTHKSTCWGRVSGCGLGFAVDIAAWQPRPLRQELGAPPQEGKEGPGEQVRFLSGPPKESEVFAYH